MFERFINCIVPFHIVCLLRYTASCIHPVLILHSSGAHPTFILHSSFLYPGVYPLCMSCLCPVYIRHSSGVHPAPNPFYHLRSNLTFGRILPRILEQVLCPRYSTFYPFLLHSISFHLSMFERFMICIVSFLLCVFYDTLHPAFIRCSSDTQSGVYPVCIPAYILCISGVCPVYIRRAPDVHSFLSSSVDSYLRSILTADSRTSLVPAILHFLSIFITL